MQSVSVFFCVSKSMIFPAMIWLKWNIRIHGLFSSHVSCYNVYLSCLGDELIYLDPHTTQPAVEPIDSCHIPDESFHCQHPPCRMSIAELDPSIAVVSSSLLLIFTAFQITFRYFQGIPSSLQGCWCSVVFFSFPLPCLVFSFYTIYSQYFSDLYMPFFSVRI